MESDDVLRMQIGSLTLGEHSRRSKEPGIRGLARVCKEGYPDFNAWDPKHPYYDPKSKEDDPTWYMVDVEFISKLAHPVPLALLQLLSRTDSSSLPPTLSQYLSASHLEAIGSSALLSRGRLSVQPVSDEFWEACVLLGEKGGWEDWDEWRGGKGKGKGKGKAKAQTKAKGKVNSKAEAASDGEAAANEQAKKEDIAKEEESAPRSQKRTKAAAKQEDDDNDESDQRAPARSTKPAAKKKVKQDENETEEAEATPTTGRRNPRRGKA